jgi:hypothetical protein
MTKAEQQRQLDALKVSENTLSQKYKTTDLKTTYALLKQDAKSIVDKVKEFPELPNKAAKALLMLYLFQGKLLHKDDIARVGSAGTGEEPTDWQVRHLAAQIGFHILGKGDLIPNTKLVCPSGWHMLVALDGVSPKYAAIKRTDLLNEDDFDTIKSLFGNRCAHCSSKEGNTNMRDSKITKLQKGHCDPNQALDKGNIIPLCDYCNRTYKDTYLFLPNGAIERINVESERVLRIVLSKAIGIHGKDKVLNIIG